MYYSLFITRSTRNEKYKRGRRRTTKINYPTLQHVEETTKTIQKTTQKLISLGSENPRVFIGNIGHQGTGTEPRVKSWRAVPHQSRGNAAQAAFPQRYLGGSRSAACCALPPCPSVGCISRFLVLGPWF